MAGGIDELAAAAVAFGAGMVELPAETVALPADTLALAAGREELAADSEELAAGSEELAAGSEELAAGFEALTAGTEALAAAGTEMLAAGTVMLAPCKVALSVAAEALAASTDVLAASPVAFVAWGEDALVGAPLAAVAVVALPVVGLLFPAAVAFPAVPDPSAELVFTCPLAAVSFGTAPLTPSVPVMLFLTFPSVTAAAVLFVSAVVFPVPGLAAFTPENIAKLLDNFKS
jgi:X-X-X-Leu-X-X-Gly heptad repeat protein